MIREYIFNTHQRDNTYFSTKSPIERNADFKTYCELNANTGLDYIRCRPLLFQLLQKNAKEINYKIESSNIPKPKSEKFQVTKGTQRGIVTVTPTQQGKPPEQPKDSTAQTVTLHPPTCQCGDCKAKRGEYSDISNDEAGGILEIAIEFWHSRNPNVKVMTPEEVEKVGKRLKPILQRHMNGDVLMYGLAFITVGNIIMDRRDQAKGLKKDDVEKSRDKANAKTEKPKEKPQPKDESLTTRKFFNKSKIKEIEQMGADENDD